MRNFGEQRHIAWRTYVRIYACMQVYMYVCIHVAIYLFRVPFEHSWNVYPRHPIPNPNWKWQKIWSYVYMKYACIHKRTYLSQIYACIYIHIVGSTYLFKWGFVDLLDLAWLVKLVLLDWFLNRSVHLVKSILARAC